MMTTQGDTSDLNQAGTGVSRSDAIDAYRILLGRLPESEAVIQYAMHYSDLSALRRAIVASPEYRHQNPERLNNVPLDAPPMRVELHGEPETVFRCRVVA